jgi:pyrimidine deaminase RibD-like protein
MILSDFTPARRAKFSREQLDGLLADLCGMIIDGQKDNSDFYGMVAAAVIDPMGRVATGVNYLYGNERIHAERAAVDNYEREYGELPPGSVVVTTLSPCNQDTGDVKETTCTSELNDKHVKLAYCGYRDPSQHDEHNDFNIVITENGKLRHLCKKFADTFLKKDLSEDISQNLPILYHGGNHQITKFNIPPSGVFFSPHKDWAENYGDVVTRVRVHAAKVYVVRSQSADPRGFDAKLLDALFDRDYDRLAEFIQMLQSKGYSALQTQTDSEMVCVFPGTKIEVLVDESMPGIGINVYENFADGKGPGRPGDSVRHGIPKHATKAELTKASHAKGRKGQLARWQLNMRNGHKK